MIARLIMLERLRARRLVRYPVLAVAGTLDVLLLTQDRLYAGHPMAVTYATAQVAVWFGADEEGITAIMAAGLVARAATPAYPALPSELGIYLVGMLVEWLLLVGLRAALRTIWRLSQ